MSTSPRADPGGTAATAAWAAGGGTLVAVSLPPWGWWPLAFVGVAALSWRVGGAPAGRRLLAGAAFGLGVFTPGLWWMGEFNVVGAALVVLLETSFLALATVAVPPGRWRALALPAALVLAEATRGIVPFGGLPMAGLALGQVAGPLAGAARVGGHLLVAGLATAVGAGLAEAARRHWLRAWVALGGAAVIGLLGSVAPDGGGGPRIEVAAVQGGGRRGFLETDSSPAQVLRAHLAASRLVRPPLELVLWPEDVVDVAGPVARSPEGAQLAAVARQTGATLVAGVIEEVGPDRFRNAAVAWSPQGDLVGRYDKVRRVPFGEYVPGRALVERLADLSPIPRDAIAGSGPGRLATPAGDLGVVISFEVFFAERARAAVRAGAPVVLVPTNAASFSTSQVPTQEVAAARLRALESGRDVVQAAPTGYSAFVDNRGRVRARTVLGRRQVVQRAAVLRSGRTLYVRWGDAPALVVAATALGAAWVGRRPALLTAWRGRGSLGSSCPRTERCASPS